MTTTDRMRAKHMAKRLAKRLAKPGATLLVGGGMLWLLGTRLGTLDLLAVRDAVYDVSALQWALALAAVMVSFLAVGGQERVLHRHLGTGISGAQAFQAGMAAGAISQTAGFGPLTGALVRWRLLPGLTLWQATRLSAALTLGFLSSLALLAALALVTLGSTGYEPLGWAILCAATVIFLLGAMRPAWLPKAGHWPNAVTMLAFVFWAMLDLSALSVALWALFPPDAEPHFATLLPAVLVALGAGLASGAPAGVGAFEMALMVLLPQLPPEALMAAILSWRAVFYALPAVIGALWTALAARPFLAAPKPAPHPAALSPRAETALAHQGTLSLLRSGPQTCLTGRTPHVLAALFEPFPGRPDNAAVSALARAARAENRFPALYKADARLAARARSLGWRSLRIACETVVATARFDLSHPARASLRRKLRKAAQAGITVTRDHASTCPALCRINAQWADRHGGERGFSMGRFCPDYLAGQRLYVAWQGGTPVAFASFHTAAQEWTLDLMRHGPALPDGTMHLLVAEAIRDAASHGIPRLSLAALPALPPALHRLFARQSAGLARFKHSFAPRSEPRYLCAPNLALLGLAAAEIARAVARPAALGPAAPPLPAPVDDDDGDYEFATVPASWHRKA